MKNNIFEKTSISIIFLISIIIVIMGFFLIKFNVELFNSIINQNRNDTYKLLLLKKDENIKSMNENIKFIANLIAANSSELLYDMEQQMIFNTLKPFMKIEEILAIEVYDNATNDSFASLWKDNGIHSNVKFPKDLNLKDTLFFMVDINYKTQNIGVLKVYYTDKYIVEKLKDLQENTLLKLKSFEHNIGDESFKYYTNQIVILILFLIIINFVAIKSMKIMRDKLQASKKEILEKNKKLENLNRELIESVSLLKSTLNSTVNGILVTDLNKNVISYNKQFLNIWNIDEGVIKSFTNVDRISFIAMQLINPKDFLEKIDEVLKSPNIKSFNVLELKDGRIIKRYSRAQIVDDKIVGIVWSFNDVTKQRLAEKNLIKKSNELEDLNKNLEERVKSAICEVRKKDELLLRQSKMASMGEMLGSIAHQWRQPLNTLGLIVQRLEVEYLFHKTLDEKMIRGIVDDSMEQIEFMSKTIDDFRNFFKVDKERIKFSIIKSIKDSVKIVSAQFNNHHITLNISGDDFETIGYPNEFGQVILNILNNAKDALLEVNNREKIIQIKVLKDRKNNIGFIYIRDNAKGLIDNLNERVFEPYFTTKHQSQGTGIGLYMSKMIIENNMNGKIYAKDISTPKEKGAEFIIELPLL